MTPMKFISTVDSRLPQLPIKEGQLIFVGDTRKICLDLDGVRTEYSQIIPLQTEQDRINYIKPINGFYFVHETKVLWNCENGVWFSLSTPPQEIIVFVENFEKLPQTGQKKVLYIVEELGTEYIWTESGYSKIGDPVWEEVI